MRRRWIKIYRWIERQRYIYLKRDREKAMAKEESNNVRQKYMRNSEGGVKRVY